MNNRVDFNLYTIRKRNDGYCIVTVNVFYETDGKYWFYDESIGIVNNVRKDDVIYSNGEFKYNYETHGKYVEIYFKTGELADEYISSLKKNHERWDMEIELKNISEQIAGLEKTMKDYKCKRNEVSEKLRKLNG